MSAFSGTLRFTRRPSSTSRTAFSLNSSDEVRRISSPCEVHRRSRVPLRSKRVWISFVAWAMAFLTSWRSTLLTMSNELSAMACRFSGWGLASHGATPALK